MTSCSNWAIGSKRAERRAAYDDQTLFGQYGLTGAGDHNRKLPRTQRRDRQRRRDRRENCTDNGAGLGGAIRIMESAIEGAAIAIGESLVPTLTKEQTHSKTRRPGSLRLYKTPERDHKRRQVEDRSSSVGAYGLTNQSNERSCFGRQTRSLDLSRTVDRHWSRRWPSAATAAERRAPQRPPR